MKAPADWCVILPYKGIIIGLRIAVMSFWRSWFSLKRFLLVHSLLVKMKKHAAACVTVILLVTLCSFGVIASTGDRSQMFHSCMEKCLTDNCTGRLSILSINSQLPDQLSVSSFPVPETLHIPLHLQLLQWSCKDECKYTCMWPTVDWFVSAGIGVQQFFGKVSNLP